MGEVIRIIFQQLFIRGQFALMAHSYKVVIFHFADGDTQEKGRVGLFFSRKEPPTEETQLGVLLLQRQPLT